MSLEHSQQVVKDEHLPVAIRAGADADGGDAICAVILAASSRGMHSSTTANAPDSATASGVVHDLIGRPLNFVCAHPADGLRTEADVAHHGNIGVDDGLDRGRHLATPFELDGLAIRLLENPPGRFESLPRRDLIAEKREIGDDERSRAARATISAW